MMGANRDLQIVEKIAGYCSDIEFTHREYEWSYDAFRTNPTYRNAICLCLLQIGELVKHLSPEYTDAHTDIPWRSIRGMRNVVAHEYGKLDVDMAWETAGSGINELRAFCNKELTMAMKSQDFTMTIQ